MGVGLLTAKAHLCAASLQDQRPLGQHVGKIRKLLCVFKPTERPDFLVHQCLHSAPLCHRMSRMSTPQADSGMSS